MEIWKDVIGYEGLYQISNFGNVKRIKRKPFCNVNKYYKYIAPTDLILNNTLDKEGYYSCSLWYKKKRIRKRIHQMLAEAFLNHTPKGKKGDMVVDHIDNNKLNNHLSNLQIITTRKNVSKSTKKTSSKYTGVSWNTDRSKWYVRFYLNRKNLFLGSFDNELDAANAYLNKLNATK